MRAFVIRSGLNDREPLVVKATQKLLIRWLEHNKIHKLLQLINLQHHAKEAEMAGMSIMSELSASADAPASVSTATSASAASLLNATQKSAILQSIPNWDEGFAAVPASDILWALIRCEYAAAHQSPAAASVMKEKLIPDTVKLCELLSEAHSPAMATNIQSQIAVRYLLRMTSFLDSSDVTGCAELTKACESMIRDLELPDSLVEPVLSAWWRGSGLSLEDCIDRVVKMSRLVRSNATADACADSVDATTTIATASVDGQEEDNDSVILRASVRALLMIEWSLQRRIGGKMTDAAHRRQRESEFEVDFLLESLQQPDVEVRGIAVRCLGLLTLVSETYCEEHNKILFQVSCMEREDTLIRSQAIQALTDMSLVYETRFKNDNALTNTLLRLHESSDPELLRIAAESACKLVFSGRLDHPRLFANLLKFFFLPEIVRQGDDEDEVENWAEGHSTFLGSSARLEQILSVFFQTYFFACNDEARKIALDAATELVADVGALVRDRAVDASSLLKVSSCLLTLSQDLEAQQQQSDSKSKKQVDAVAEDDDDEEENETATSGSEQTGVRREFCVRLAAAVSREILKLGNSKHDRACAKEFIKVLGILSPSSWINSAPIAQVVHSIMNALASIGGSDKPIAKVVDAYHTACTKALQQHISQTVAHQSAGTDFLNYAPGLADLVELLGAKSSEDLANEGCEPVKEAVAAKVTKSGKKTKVTTKASKKSKVETEEEDENEDDNEEVAPTEATVTKTSGRAARSSKTAASMKIASQAASDI